MRIPADAKFHMYGLPLINFRAHLIELTSPIEAPTPELTKESANVRGKLLALWGNDGIAAKHDRLHTFARAR